jgi:peptidyl-prolyl cis-trans isomerase C
VNIRIILTVALLAPALATAQQVLEKKEKAAEKAAKPAARPAAKGGNIATVNGVAVPAARAEFMMQQQAQRGAPDNEQMRKAVREELINREVLAQEAQRTGAARVPEVQTQLDMLRQEILVQYYLRDFARKNPISEACATSRARTRSARPRSRRNTTAPRRSTATRSTRHATSWSKPRTRPRA